MGHYISSLLGMQSKFTIYIVGQKLIQVPHLSTKCRLTSAHQLDITNKPTCHPNFRPSWKRSKDHEQGHSSPTHLRPRTQSTPQIFAHTSLFPCQGGLVQGEGVGVVTEKPCLLWGECRSSAGGVTASSAGLRTVVQPSKRVCWELTFRNCCTWSR